MKPERIPHYAQVITDIAVNVVSGDRLIISGFWRSGTTWLLARACSLLKAKPLFEPFAPDAYGVTAKSNAQQQIFMPLSFAGLGPQHHTMISRLNRGFARGGLPYFTRNSIAEALRPGIVFKFTRAGFLLEQLNDALNAKTLHIRRDPCAVYSSLRNARWQWSLDDVRLSSLYPESNDDTPADAETKRLLRAYDTSTVRRIAALWALSEKAAEEAARKNSGITIAQYEGLLDSPDELQSILSALGYRIRGGDDFYGNSPVTEKNRENVSLIERKSGLKEKLPRETISELQAVTEELFPASERLSCGLKSA